MASSLPESLQILPTPWDLKSRCWIFVLSALKSTSNFPAGWAAPYQAEALSQGEWAGSLGFVQVYSYSDSPAGPYNELIYCPGRMKNKDGSVGSRISRIYVSSEASVYNGRKNWNIPKQLADFKIEKQQTGSWLIEVSLRGSSTPFFKIFTNPIPILSSIPFPFNCSPQLSCPPLPSGENELETGTEKWGFLVCSIKGSARLARCEAALGDGANKQIADGVAFPNVQPWTLGLMLEGVESEFPEPTWHDDW